MTSEKVTKEQKIAKLSVPGMLGRRTAIYPFFYNDVADPRGYGLIWKPSESGFVEPTFAETICLLHDVLIGKPNRKIVHDINLASSWIWCIRTSTGILPVKGGVYIQDRMRLVNGKPTADESELARRYMFGDPKVRFVPYGFNTNPVGWDEIIQNPMAKGLIGRFLSKKITKKFEAIVKSGFQIPQDTTPRVMNTTCYFPVRNSPNFWFPKMDINPPVLASFDIRNHDVYGNQIVIDTAPVNPLNQYGFGVRSYWDNIKSLFAGKRGK